MNPFDDNYFMKKALEEAQLAYEKGEIPVGAIVVVENRIIARAHNLTEQLTAVTAHAEMHSITSASHYLGGKYLNQCTLYVTLEPCAMCTGALYWSQLGKLVYGAPDPKRGGLSQGGAIHPKTELIHGVLAEQASELITQFFSQRRKKNP